MSFDLRSQETRILECAKCDEPAAAEGWTGRVALRCGYCGFDDVRELVAAQAVVDGDAVPYREGRRVGGVALRANLERPPPGMSDRESAERLRERWLSLKRAPAPEADDARVEHEYELLWVATGSAARLMARRDFLHARAVLETALERLTIPAYRGLVLVRLARLAALGNAPELAEKWLSAVPQGLRIAELTSDVKVVDAMIARARGDHAGVLRIIGERDTANELVGPSRWIGLALRVDAHEKMGDLRAALDVWRSSLRGNAFVLTSTAVQLDLAPLTRKRSSRRALVGLAGGGVALFGLVSMLVQLGDPPGAGLRPWMLVVFGFVVLLAAKRV